jgi:uncharacterized protein (TIGR02145 family)
MIMKRLLTVSVLFAMMVFSCKKDKKSLATITTTATSNLTATSVSSGGTITDDGESAITKRGIAWATHAGPTVGDSITNDGSGSGSFTTNLAGLNSNTTYYIRAYAINASGTAYGNELTFKTSQGVPTISTTSITDIQPLSAKSGGNITNDGGTPVTDRGLVYATTQNPTIANLKITAGSGTGTFTATLSPLASQQTYYVRAYATNSQGTAYGNQVQFNAASANTVTDIDGNVYPYITLCGGKSWLAANLKVTRYTNGDAIVNGLTGFDWQNSTAGAYTFPNGEVNRKDSFGLYYNGAAMIDTRGICPTGWHVPSDDEWKALEVCQGMTQAEADAAGCRGTIAAKFLEGGTSGLNIQLSGYLLPTNPASYFGFRQEGGYWTSTPRFASYRNRGFNVSSCGPTPVFRGNGGAVYSIRCIKD